MWRDSFHGKDLSGGGGGRGCSLSWMTVDIETGGVSSFCSTFCGLDDQ